MRGAERRARRRMTIRRRARRGSATKQMRFLNVLLSQFWQFVPICVLIPLRDFGNREVVHLGAVSLDRIGCDRAREFARRLKRESGKEALDEPRAVRIARARGVDGILDRHCRDLYLLFARDDTGTLFAERYDERLHMLQYLPLRHPRLLQDKSDLVVVAYHGFRSAYASAQLFVRQRGYRLTGIEDKSPLVLAVPLGQKDHVRYAPRRDHRERDVVRLDLASVCFPSRPEMKRRDLVVRVVGDDERGRRRLIGKGADRFRRDTEFLHPCAVADKVCADRADDTRLLSEKRQTVRDIARGAAEL